jgi:hypothetical protein
MCVMITCYRQFDSVYICYNKTRIKTQWDTKRGEGKIRLCAISVMG